MAGVTGPHAPLRQRELHDRALLDLEGGAVTPSNRAELGRLAPLLDALLAGLMVSSLQFEHHSHLVRGVSTRPLADFLRDCAETDRAAARTVAERVHQLGFAAGYDPQHLTARSAVPFRTFTESELTAEPGALVTGNLPGAVVAQNLLGVRILLQTLQELVRWTGDDDSTSRRLLERVLEAKEHQADILSAERTGGSARP